ncbi:MAG: tripartite tricarboxylate transporter substrate binding protein [Burkholderiales bacterium]
MSVRPLSRRSFLHTAGAAGLGTLVPSLARAQAYPAKPVKIVVGFAAGGGTDVLARLDAQGLADKLGQPFVVENKTGAGGNIATTFVAKSPADGYTLLVSSVGQTVVSPHTDRTLQVDPLKDLAHITMLAEGDLLLGVHTDVPVKTIQEFIAYAKQNPGKLNYATAGAGSNLHLFTEYFMMTAGVDVQAVHYRGGTAMTPDLMSGQVQISLNGVYALDPYFRAGKLRPLVVLGRQREPRFPDVPTCTEIGMPQLAVCTNWFGLHAPAGTPEPIVQALYETTAAYLKSDGPRTKITGMGMRIGGDIPQAFTARIAQDYKVFGEVARRANVQTSALVPNASLG